MKKMKSRFLILFAMGLVLIGFSGIAFATHDPNQPYMHSIILPHDMKEKTFDEFMEWCKPHYGDKCIELEKKRVPKILSPLKQIKSGIPFNEIQCQENLVLIHKYDDSPACVISETREKLIERKWANAESDKYVLKYSPVLFSGTGVDLQEDDLMEHLKNKREQLHIVVNEIGAKALYPITGMSFSIGHNAYSLDEKYVGAPVALEIEILKEEFTKETLEEVNQFIRKYVGDEIDIVYSKGDYAFPINREIDENE